METVIDVKNITKSFRVYYDKGSQLKEKMLFWKRNRYEERWVLKGISFQIKKGEAVGLIGHNGCGKSTTLKLLSRIIYPNNGTIEMKGRVSSLIELGAGFHPDMSGRENIYTNAAIFGLTKKEIDERIDDIISFSELEEFIDNPVRTYSSGMYMRLAFSVAINVDADILLIDEILAVGDANFQAKCFNRLREIKKSGTTIVIVSHSLGQIEQICDRSIWIDDGKIRMEGTPREVHAEYLGFMGKKREEIAEKERKRKENNKKNDKEENSNVSVIESNEIGKEKGPTFQEPKNQDEKVKKRWGNGYAKIIDIAMCTSDGEKRTVFQTGSDVDIVIKFTVKNIIKDAVFGIAIYNSKGMHCYGTNTKIDKLDEFELKKDGQVIVHLKHLNLLPEVYTLDLAIECEIGLPVDYYTEAYRFEMYSMYEEVGIVRIDHTWELDK